MINEKWLEFLTLFAFYGVISALFGVGIFVLGLSEIVGLKTQNARCLPGKLVTLIN